MSTLSLTEFFKGYDLTNEEQVREVFKVMLDWPELFGNTTRLGALRHMKSQGWAQDRLDEIERSVWSKWSNPRYVEEQLQSNGFQVFKEKSWTLGA